MAGQDHKGKAGLGNSRYERYHQHLWKSSEVQGYAVFSFPRNCFGFNTHRTAVLQLLLSSCCLLTASKCCSASDGSDRNVSRHMMQHVEQLLQHSDSHHKVPRGLCWAAKSKDFRTATRLPNFQGRGGWVTWLGVSWLVAFALDHFLLNTSLYLRERDT